MSFFSLPDFPTREYTHHKTFSQGRHGSYFSIQRLDLVPVVPILHPNYEHRSM
jgi:hypothetical protein